MKNTKCQIINREDIPQPLYIGRVFSPAILDYIHNIPSDGKVLVKELPNNKELLNFLHSVRHHVSKHNLNITIITRGLNVYAFVNHTLPAKE